MDNNSFPWESIFSIVSFVIGFIFGLIQLWQSQKYFLADQQSKFEKISDNISQISQRLAVIEEVTTRLIEIDRAVRVISATSDGFQTRLVSILERQFDTREGIGEATVKTSNEIAELVTQQFANSVDKKSLDKLEEKLDIILSDLGNRIAKIAESNASLPIQPVNLADSDKAISPKDGVIINTATRTVIINGQTTVDLTAREYDLLRFLYEQAGQLVSTEDILIQLYPNEEHLSIDSNYVSALVRRLRQKIEPDPTIPKYLLTVRGRGYRFIPKGVDN